MSATLTRSPRPAELADATPASRDRYLDLLRAVSIGVVALGHWLLAVVAMDPDGALTGGNALVEVPALQRLTWVFQVMPLFFIVGGVVNARSWRSAVRRGVSGPAWVRGRLQRLVAPTMLFVAVWSVAAAVAAAAGLDRGTLVLGTRLVAVPLWFLAVYVPVVALVPVMLRLHERYGMAVPVALTAAAAVSGLLHGQGVAIVGWTSFLTVWLVPQQLGFAWGDGHPVTRPGRGAWLALAGLAALVLLTTIGSFPVSMVGVDDAARSNNAPPTIALVALTVLQLGVATALRGAADRWLQRRRVWIAVIAVNARAMTIYLWHLTALVIVAVTLVPRGFLAGVVPGSATWWATRPLWLGVLAIVLVPIVVLVGRAESPGGGGTSEVRPSLVVVAVGALSLATALLATEGFHVPTSPGGVPTVALGAGAVGTLALRSAGRRPSAASTAPH